VQLEDYGVTFLFHAVCGLSGFAWSMLGHQGYAYGAVGFIWEASTPFVNNIFLLRTYCPDMHWLHLINAVVLLFVFVTARGVIGMPASYGMWTDLKAHFDAGQAGMAEFGGFSVLLVGLNTLNVVWLFALVKGTWKIAKKVFGPAKAGGDGKKSK
jgi:hypothetical protein